MLSLKSEQGRVWTTMSAFRSFLLQTSNSWLQMILHKFLNHQLVDILTFLCFHAP